MGNALSREEGRGKKGRKEISKDVSLKDIKESINEKMQGARVTEDEKKKYKSRKKV